LIAKTKAKLLKAKAKDPTYKKANAKATVSERKEHFIDHFM